MGIFLYLICKTINLFEFLTVHLLSHGVILLTDTMILDWSIFCTITFRHFIFSFLISYQYEPSHEIMANFVLRKLILQTRMRSHPVWLDVWFFVGPFV